MKRFLLYCMLLFAGLQVLAAAPPATPVEFQGYLSELNIYLYWKKSADQSITGYKLYMAYAETGTPQNFSEIKKILALDSKDTFNLHRAEYTADKAGKYIFFVTAYNKDGESAPSDSHSVTIEAGLYFMQWAESRGEVGKQFKFTPNVEYRGPGNPVIRYKWDPERTQMILYPMPLDTITGEIKFTPSIAAPHGGTLIAYLRDNPTISAKLLVNVWFRCKNVPTVTFMFSDTNDAPLQDYSLSFTRYRPDGQPFIGGGGNVKNGLVIFSADAGEHYISIGKMGDNSGVRYWLPNFTTNRDSAQPYTFECGKEYNFNFTDVAYLVQNPLNAEKTESTPGSLSIFPHPVSETAHINFDGEAGNTTIKVLSVLGEEILSDYITSIDGNNRYVLDVKAWPSGQYFVNIINGSRVRSLPVTVMH